MNDQPTQPTARADLEFFLESANARRDSIQRKLDCGSRALGSRAETRKLRDRWQAEADRIAVALAS